MKNQTLLIGLAALTGVIHADAALVAYYTLDNATTNAADSAGSNTGTFIGTPTAVAGLFGNAYSFNGSSGVNLGSTTDVRPTGDFTVTFWVNQSTATNANQLIIGASNTIANTGAGWLVKPQDGGRVFFNTAATSNVNGADRVLDNTNNMTANAADWHFMAARYVQSTGVFSYTLLTLNSLSAATTGTGIATATTTNTASAANSVLAYGASPPVATIGSRTGGADGFVGLIDEVKYYSDVRSNADLASDYNAGVAIIPEPSSAILLGALGALGLLRRRR